MEDYELNKLKNYELDDIKKLKYVIDELVEKVEKKEITTKKDIDEYIKTSLHYEKQKFKNEKDKNITLEDIIEKVANFGEQKKLLYKREEHRIEAIGIDITDMENKAMNAILTLFSRTNYKGNRKGVNVKGQIFNYNGYLPEIEFYPNEYLEVFGVKKYKTGRGKMEYSAEGRRQAFDSLVSLAMKQFFIHYIRTYWINDKSNKPERRHDVIREISPLINIREGWEYLTDKELNKTMSNHEDSVSDKKRTKIAVRPAPILIDQIETYFIIKPANYIQEINMKAMKMKTKISKFTYRFIDLLFVEVTQNLMKKGNSFEWIFERNYKTLATNLRMDNYIKLRKWKLIRETITASYEIAKNLGYINSYELDTNGKTKELDKLYLNPDKFYKMKEIEEELKKLDH